LIKKTFKLEANVMKGGVDGTFQKDSIVKDSFLKDTILKDSGFVEKRDSERFHSERFRAPERGKTLPSTLGKTECGDLKCPYYGAYKS
jgi:hypothetical protein